MNHIEKVLKDYQKGKIDINCAIKECIPLIRSTLIKKFNKINDDLEQESIIVALNCLKNYSKDKNCTFSTYLCNNIKWVIGRYMWRDKLIRKPVNLFEKGIDTKDYKICSDIFKMNSSKNIKEGNILDLIVQDDYLDKMFINSFMLKDILGRLKYAHKEILILWAEGHTYKDIAKKYSISISGAEQKVKKALEIARKLVINSEYKDEYKGLYTTKNELLSNKTKSGKDRKTKYSKELLNEIRERKLTLRQISDKYGIGIKIITNLDQRIKKGVL